MFAHIGFTESYMQMRVDELLHEAELERMANLAAGPGRPWRTRVAGWLTATAEWVEGQPQASVASAEA